MQDKSPSIVCRLQAWYQDVQAADCAHAKLTKTARELFGRFVSKVQSVLLETNAAIARIQTWHRKLVTAECRHEFVTEFMRHFFGRLEFNLKCCLPTSAKQRATLRIAISGLCCCLVLICLVLAANASHATLLAKPNQSDARSETDVTNRIRNTLELHPDKEMLVTTAKLEIADTVVAETLPDPSSIEPMQADQLHFSSATRATRHEFEAVAGPEQKPFPSSGKQVVDSAQAPLTVWKVQHPNYCPDCGGSPGCLSQCRGRFRSVRSRCCVIRGRIACCGSRVRSFFRCVGTRIFCW